MNSTKSNYNNAFNGTAHVLLAILDARSRDIITRRYGLETGNVETLDSIGKEYGITRERVRQIESQGKKLLARRRDVLDEVAEVLREVFKNNGGILTEDLLMELINQELTESQGVNTVVFYLDILHPYERITKSDMFDQHWSHPDLHNEYAGTVIAEAERALKREKKPVAEQQLIEKVRSEIGVSNEDLPNNCIYALLKAGKHLKKTVFGEWGLIDWVETTPRGVGDKAFIVLRRHGKPAHFREITEMIREVGFDHKNAHEQTVHNELIKDGRFVLVGRGLYGLTDWGYIPGTVADVLEEVLKDAKGPLTRDELLKKVLDQRMVKKTTVLLGLQNNNKFQRVDGDKYLLREQ